MILIQGTILPTGINTLIRMHWAKRKKKQQEIIEDITQNNPKALTTPFGCPVDILYTRKSTRYMDWDNAAGSFKLIGDALVTLGIILDDNPNVVINFQVKQQKVKKRDEQGYEVLICKASSVSEMRIE